ncbi:MAG TPA: RodZ domain-containing protein [Candidatus Omnitrophota bacterium]|nr:RodZ domain-containing protein [Candidatus Omnitrophota bacterium]
MTESVGIRLKKARLEKGLSLEEVQKKTKIHLSVLKAIEEDTLINISSIYMKGFLKIYSKFLGLDPKGYLPDSKEPPASQILAAAGIQKSPSFFESTSIRLKSWRPNKKIKLGIIYALGFILTAILLFNLGKAISYRLSRSRHSAKIQKTKPSLKPKETKPQEIIPVKPAISSSIRLGVLAREDCWLSLKLDGRTVFSSVLKKGKSETWQAKERIEITLNKPGAVDLIVNGERISPLAKKEKGRKLIVITREGIKIQ